MNNISITTDLLLFADKSEYDNLLARLNLDNFGKIYYYIDTMEPLDVEDVIEIIMDQDQNLSGLVINQLLFEHTKQQKKHRKRNLL